MGFIDWPAKVRKDPLGPQTLSVLRRNLEWLRQMIRVEHIVTTGEHNAWEVPRVCCRVTHGTPPVVTGDALGYLSGGVTNPATGQYTITLDTNIFTTDMRVQLNLPADNVFNKPHLVGYEVASATSLKVYINELSSALGAGNAWAAVNRSFDVAIHSDPLDTGAWEALPVLADRGDTLDTVTDGQGAGTASDQFHWNLLVRRTADLYAAFRGYHTAAGVHAVREVARYSGRVAWKSSTNSYTVEEASGISASYVSSGIVDITYAALTTPVSAFVCPDYARVHAAGTPGDLFVCHAYAQNTTTTRVYMYQYNPTAQTWARANCDFFIAVHGT